ncbi:hypothetical protein J4423_01070 [Candidatus Pacearchaeota archaeon]|nr:hypothetical protein [Candidatus Pacearchaeota archaeon]
MNYLLSIRYEIDDESGCGTDPSYSRDYTVTLSNEGSTKELVSFRSRYKLGPRELDIRLRQNLSMSVFAEIQKFLKQGELSIEAGFPEEGSLLAKLLAN